MAFEDVRRAVFEDVPEDLELPIKSIDHSDHVVTIGMRGYPQLAADHLLNCENVGKISKIIPSIIRQLNLEFLKNELSPQDTAETKIRKVRSRKRAYEVLIEIALNVVGAEGVKVGFSEDEIKEVLNQIIQVLELWESLEDPGKLIIKTVVEKLIRDMKIVASGNGMVPKMAEEVENRLVENRLASSFIKAAYEVMRENVYFKMTLKKMCRFGNDYAIGLRWLRHLGFVQVSTNPVLAAKAYDDDSRLWEEFRKVVKNHPEWYGNPESFRDEIAMAATMIALWPNLLIFRPISLLSNMLDGMVSYQLNPKVAGTLKGSLADALRIYSSAQEFLRVYDAYLLWGYASKNSRGGPNLVFKVAGSSPVAIDVTFHLNRMGIGTNNTVTFSVSQEVNLIMAAMRGMAEAKRMGIPITKVYETNMGGRLESHLREVEAERIVWELLNEVDNKEGFVKTLAERLGASELNKKTLTEKIRLICSFKYLKSLTDSALKEALESIGLDKGLEGRLLKTLAELEEAIQYSGTFVARKVYRIFFSPENRIKWINYLQRKFNLSRAEAEEIMSKIDVLPASKRKPNDTYLTLARKNLTNTEFPNHQYNVLQASRQQGFRLEGYDNAILLENDLGILSRLLEIPDFRKAYELTPELAKELRNVGIEEKPNEGLKPEEWPNFGPVVKTMQEFTEAYEKFAKATVDFVRKVAELSR